MTAPLKPPTSPQGYVDRTWMYALGDVLETIPDLTPGLAVSTYAAMRRDPQLAAILAAYTLPIRRATWAVDPTGCRPEVAQLVADDLGLPVVGDDTPGAARTRGVSWPEHLRAALLHLTFGAYGFELLAEVEASGTARLAALLERTPQTVARIHVDEQGRLQGISQDGRAGDEAPQIPVGRLCWYVHDREGANWYGTSLLRPAYAAYVLKREAQRILATSSRRFGMGVPTVEWANGTSPTPGQMQQAQQAASAARVGDQAGLTLPPGATLVLKGLSGSSPDTLAFIKWLDQQMSRMALAGFLDLGQTETGSRALGEAFLDLFLLSIQSAADYVADTVTRQVAARVVGWNWGDTEPVPAVRVSDIGTRHDITADAIQQLMAAGAVTADPALEAYVRRAYRLPQSQRPAAADLPESANDTAEPATSEPETPATDPGAGPADRQNDLDWGLFGGGLG